MFNVTFQGTQAFTDKLKQFAKATQTDSEDMVKEMARIGSRQLAMKVEPMGLSKKAETIATMAVSKDVSLAYASNRRTYANLARISQGKAKAYARAINAGDLAAAEKIVKTTLTGWSEVIQNDTGGHLESVRNSRGRVDAPSMVNLAQDGNTEQIRRDKMQTAGIAKAAWLQAGASIGAKTRIAAWLKKSGSLGRSSIVKAGWNTVVTLWNNCSYVSNVLDDRRINMALKATSSNILRRMEMVLQGKASKI